jgi:Ser/Thr protein kinase RdoA (MazF antagonist)
MNTTNHPYDNLSPDVILSAIESLGLHCSGSLHTLNSYENRVFQIGIEDGPPLIAKFYRPNRWSDAAILEEHQFSQELIDYEIAVVAPWQNAEKKTLHEYQGFKFALFPRWGGHALELDNLDQLEWMGRFIGRLHAVSACNTFKHRPQLTAQRLGYDSYQFLKDNNIVPSYLQHNYFHLVETALTHIDTEFLQASPIRNIRLHGDMHAGNVLWDTKGPHIVDLDDCMMGPAIQDIWMLLSGDEHQFKIQLEKILKGYQEFYDFNPQELNLIESLRTLRMLHYSAWIAKRWQDPAFPANFPWFNTDRYWQEQTQYLAEQVSLLNKG